jgi:uncharacterized membrane protein YgcG
VLRRGFSYLPSANPFVRGLAAVFVAIAAAGGLAIGFPTQASAAEGEQLRTLTINAELQDNGDLQVEETIVWDFSGTYGKRGIFRYVPEKRPWTGKRPEGARDWEKFERITEVDWRSVSSPTGAPTGTDFSTERYVGPDGDTVYSVVRIGDADLTVSGLQTYTIRYVIEHAVTDGVLQFTAVGEGWTVPVGNVTVNLAVPMAAGAKPVCLRAVISDTCAVSVRGDVVVTQAVGAGVEIEVPVSPALPVRSPRIEAVHSLRGAFDYEGVPGAMGALGVVGAIAGSIIAGRKGRDRVFASGSALGQAGDTERPRKLNERLASPVEFEPPEGIRPGLILPARTGESNQSCISAMLVDLAARKVVQIEPLDDKGDNFRIVRLGGQPRLSLTQNEEHLLNVLLPGGQEAVTLDELSGRIPLAGQMTMLRGLLVNEAVDHGWWVSNPRMIRNKWRGYGVGLVILGGIFTVIQAIGGSFGLFALAIIALGIGLLAVAQSMPIRTATGSRIEARLRGFELLFDAGEGERLQLAERQHLFAEYLPYAMAFGNVDKWVGTFAKMGIQPAVPYFGPVGYGPGYPGYPGYYPGGWGQGRFEDAMSRFDRSLNESIVAGAAAEQARQAEANRSSSGGSGGGSFGGGGSSGGGGGGSW